MSARELERVDAYFAGYEEELRARVARTRSAEGAAKLEARLAAARAEHARHRADQLARHEVVLRPHFDALVMVAEPAWVATVRLESGRDARELRARFVPCGRRWVVTDGWEGREILIVAKGLARSGDVLVAETGAAGMSPCSISPLRSGGIPAAEIGDEDVAAPLDARLRCGDFRNDS